MCFGYLPKKAIIIIITDVIIREQLTFSFLFFSFRLVDLVSKESSFNHHATPSQKSNRYFSISLFIHQIDG